MAATETYAYFTDIRKHLLAELREARSEICVAVAWLTDQRLFRALCEKASAGVVVHLMINDDQINQASQIVYQDLETAGGHLFLVNASLSGTLMHNKFCVIDQAHVITGSYNWSNRAGSNHENITITKNDHNLAASFLAEFGRLKKRYESGSLLKPFDAAVVYKRLQLIQMLISLGDLAEVPAHYTKLTEYQLTGDLTTLMEMLERRDYTAAGPAISLFLSKANALTIDDEIQLNEIRWRISYLETEVVALENERSDAEKTISDFVHLYTLNFGELLLNILQRKKEILKKQGSKRSAAYEQAETDYRDFEEQFKAQAAAPKPELTSEDMDELKKLYRKAAMLCHPDKFNDETAKVKAQLVFTALLDAYQGNDLDKVKEIFGKLQQGLFDIHETNKATRREQLVARLAELEQKYQVLQAEIQALHKDETYKKVNAIRDIDLFWKEERERLESELKSLANEQ